MRIKGRSDRALTASSSSASSNLVGEGATGYEVDWARRLVSHRATGVRSDASEAPGAGRATLPDGQVDRQAVVEFTVTLLHQWTKSPMNMMKSSQMISPRASTSSRSCSRISMGMNKSGRMTGNRGGACETSRPRGSLDIHQIEGWHRCEQGVANSM